ncbi:hypothetical protein Celaphus_00015056 [Cervus elaphus hippelaphus]|uniref:Uncharacterized protein n=1 Tax=Cervus elaphus hippelaphus TaxID=46360 RepID=A0A212D2Y5_CEREH|nr:hypothetical protein Celaphus_00015056 [Cervus elaphus hippelaphus]
MLSPAKSLDTAMEKHQKRAKDENGVVCATDTRPLEAGGSRAPDGSKQKKPVLVRQVCTTEPLEAVTWEQDVFPHPEVSTEALHLTDVSPADNLSSGHCKPVAREPVKELQESESIPSAALLTPTVGSPAVPAEKTHISPLESTDNRPERKSSGIKNPGDKANVQEQSQPAATTPSTCEAGDTQPSVSFSSLKTATSFTWCYLMRQRALHLPQTDQKTSAYTNWAVSASDPNPLGLPTKVALSLLSSKQKTGRSLYCQAITTHFKSDLLVCSSKWKSNLSKRALGNLTKHMKSKTHSKKCVDLGVSVGLTDEQDTEESDEKQRFSFERSGYDPEESDGAEDDENENEEDEDSQAESVHLRARGGPRDPAGADEDAGAPEGFPGGPADPMDVLLRALPTKMTVLSALQSDRGGNLGSPGSAGPRATWRWQPAHQMGRPGLPSPQTHLFSHLPLHSQQQSRTPYNMVPVGGIQVVPAGLTYSTFVPIQAGPVQLTIPAVNVIHRPLGTPGDLSADMPGAASPAGVAELSSVVRCIPIGQTRVPTLQPLPALSMETVNIVGLASANLGPQVRPPGLALNAVGLQVVAANPVSQSSPAPPTPIPGLQILNIALPTLIPSVSQVPVDAQGVPKMPAPLNRSPRGAPLPQHSAGAHPGGGTPSPQGSPGVQRESAQKGLDLSAPARDEARRDSCSPRDAGKRAPAKPRHDAPGAPCKPASAPPPPPGRPRLPLDPEAGHPVQRREQRRG